MKMSDKNIEKPMFANQLREAGKHLHSAVENTLLIQSIFNGEITEEVYKKYLLSLYGIYSELEKQIVIFSKDQSLRFIFEPLVIPELFRSRSIEQDLDAFRVSDSEAPESAKKYQNHLNKISVEKPHCLIAHYYLRFLGDLFGGQTIAGKLSCRFEGKLAFYDFTELCQKNELSAPMQFARSLRQIFNNLPLLELQRRDILKEVLKGYRMHLQLFEELAAQSVCNE